MRNPFGTVPNTQLNQLQKGHTMPEYYKGQRITELLNQVAQAEKKLNDLGVEGASPELALAYTTIAIAKAKLTALQGEKK